MRMVKQLWMIAMMLVLVVWAGYRSVEAQQDPALSVPVWFGIEMAIAPDGDAGELWRCGAFLRDLVSGEVLAAPTIVFAGGEKASVQSGLQSEMLWVFEVEVSGDGGEATWSSKVSMGDQLLSISTGSVQLAPKR